jgi:hypothetical protein
MPRWRSLFRGALGLGHDPRSNTYKVARFFYRCVDLPIGGGFSYTSGMEVFTIGKDRSLLWTIDESLLLEDELGVRGF